MIGIISAMPVELEAILHEMKQPQEEAVGGVTFTRGMLAGQEVVAAVSGIGKVHAAMCAQAMILQYQPEVMINTGVAGCLAPGIEIGDVVVATAAVQHDMDTVSLGDAPGMISGLGRVELPCAAEVSARLEKSIRDTGGRVHRGIVASGDQFISDRSRKQWIQTQFGALCCEMEGAAIAQVCYRNGTDCAILRAISDNADGEANEDFLSFLQPAVQRTVQAMLLFLSER